MTPYRRCQSFGSADRRRDDSRLGRGGGSDSSGRRRGLGPARGGAGRAGIRTLGREINARLGSLMLCVGGTRSRQASDSQTDTVLDNRPAGARHKSTSPETCTIVVTLWFVGRFHCFVNHKAVFIDGLHCFVKHEALFYWSIALLCES